MSLPLSKDAKYTCMGLQQGLKIWKCWLTELVPGGHDLNWEINFFSLLSVPDLSGSMGTCNKEQNLHHWVVRWS